MKFIMHGAFTKSNALLPRTKDMSIELTFPRYQLMNSEHMNDAYFKLPIILAIRT